MGARLVSATNFGNGRQHNHHGHNGRSNLARGNGPRRADRGHIDEHAARDLCGLYHGATRYQERAEEVQAVKPAGWWWLLASCVMISGLHGTD